MIREDKILKAPDWSKNNINRWADYIELLCLYGTDHLVSKDDVLNVYFDGNSEELQRGETEHSAKYDKLVSTIGNYYEIIKYRNKTHEQYYPFNMEDNQCISLKSNLNGNHMQYIFLLLCSSICFMDSSSMQKLTHSFERYCQPIMEILVPKDAKTQLFGTSRENGQFSGTLRKRIEQLANYLGAQTTKALDKEEKYDRAKAGDAGLDIVSYLKLDDASHGPLALGQCTCSYDDWKDKQTSIDYDTWRARIAPLPPYCRYMYVPFFCRNASGKFENPTDIHSCLIDRQRILNILALHTELFNKTKQLDIKNLLQEIW